MTRGGGTLSKKDCTAMPATCATAIAEANIAFVKY